MFSSKSKDSVTVTPPPAPAFPAKRGSRSSAAPSIISADLTVVGTLTSTGDIQIDGHVDGDVRSAGLVIGEKAQISGEIRADDVTVRGHVKGRIRARKVLLCATSRVEGDILHEAFAVEAGAYFEGNCRHTDNPLADEVSAKPIAPAAMKPAMDVKPAAAPSAMSAIMTPPLPGIAATGN